MNIQTAPEIETALDKGAPVAIGISGGKDSGALAIALVRSLLARGHPRNKILLVHADLGDIEWPQSDEWVRKLALFLNIELVVVRRPAGGMIDRWEKRWADNKARYSALKCVTLILPWSTPSMRFCTSELKVAPITSELRKRYPNEPVIINATGIRAQESKKRAELPLFQEQAKLKHKNGIGYDWHPIQHWKIEEVFAIQKESGFPLHPAYTEFGSSRLSCSFCILATDDDHKAAASFTGNTAAYVRLCTLEINSAFSFKGNKWLSDLRPDLLPPDFAEKLAKAKEREKIRALAESKIPKDLLFTKGWPLRAPSLEEAIVMAEVRQTVLATAGLESPYIKPDAIIARYLELMEEAALKQRAKDKIQGRKNARAAKKEAARLPAVQLDFSLT